MSARSAVATEQEAERSPPGVSLFRLKTASKRLWYRRGASDTDDIVADLDQLLGIYATVTAPGAVRVGDAVTLV